MIGYPEAPWARKRNCEACHKDKSPRKFLKVDGYVASFWSTCQDCRPWIPEKRNRGRAATLIKRFEQGRDPWDALPTARRWHEGASRSRPHLRKASAPIRQQIILDGRDEWPQPRLGQTIYKSRLHRTVPQE